MNGEHQLRSLLSEFVARNGFNNLVVAQSWLRELANSNNTAELNDVFDSWTPDSVNMLYELGGTNCIGLTEILRQMLEHEGFKTELAITPSTNLPEGISRIEVPFQHAAFYVTDEEGIVYLVDPGLGLVEPIVLTMENSVSIADRTYTVIFLDEMQRLEVTKPNGDVIHFDFIDAPQGFDLESGIQKPLLRATSVFKIDKFNQDGRKTCSIKIDFMKRLVSYFVLGEVNSMTFNDLNDLEKDSLFNNVATELEDDELAEKIIEAVNRELDIVNIWFEPLQRQYYLENSDLLSPYETSWEELGARGYEGGGVVVVLHDGQGRVLLYEIPKSREKPHINRFAGNYNLFTETAEPNEGLIGVSNLEDPISNVGRAFREEIGIEPPGKFVYREVDYGSSGPRFRARIFIYEVDPSVIGEIAGFNGNSSEIGRVEWVSLLENNKPLDQNALNILVKLVNNGLLDNANS